MGRKKGKKKFSPSSSVIVPTVIPLTKQIITPSLPTKQPFTPASSPIATGNPITNYNSPPSSDEQLNQLYNKYADPPTEEGEFIGPDGIERFCNDLVLAPDSIEILCLCHALKAKTMGYFSKSEFMEGLQTLRCYTLPSITSKSKAMVKSLDDPKTLKQIYEYSFNFGKGQKKMIDLETAESMMQIVIGNRFYFTPLFVDFLKQSVYKGLTLDQWMCFLEFSKTTADDLSNCDESSCWPLILDEFVDYLKAESTAKQQKK